MKIFCVFFTAFVLSVQPDVTRGKTCYTEQNCRPDECCMTRSSMVGGCRQRGCEGCPCQPKNVKSYLGDMYLMACPCADGLECVAEEEILNAENEIVEYVNATCQKTHSATNLKPRVYPLFRFLRPKE